MLPKRILYLTCGLSFILSVSIQAQHSTSLPRSIPEDEGVSSSAIINFLDALDRSSNEFHSFMLIRHGKVIAETWWKPYRPDLRHTMYSTSKSFTSTAVGFAVTEGKLKLSDKVISFFQNELPDTVSPALAALTVRDVITMSVGQRPDPTTKLAGQGNWVKYFLSVPIIDTPGKKFLYNSVGTYMLSAIVQKVTGQKVIDYLRPRLFEPLGIEGMDWEISPQGVNSGGWGLRLKTEDMAKFGLLYLQKGMWRGKQILSKEWIEEATSFKIDQAPGTPQSRRDSSDWLQGYCYQFWRCRHNEFRADGAFGQYIIMLPEQDAVIAITSETGNMQDELNLIWTHLLPAFKNEKLALDKKEEELLRKKLTAESLPVAAQSTDPALVSGITGKKFKMENNDLGIQSVSFQFGQKGCTLEAKIGDSSYSILFDRGGWHMGETTAPGIEPALIGITRTRYIELGPAKIAASYSWKSENDLELFIRYVESPHSLKLLCHFENDTVSIQWESSVKRLSHAKNDTVLKGSMEK